VALPRVEKITNEIMVFWGQENAERHVDAALGNGGWMVDFPAEI
jgi:hypothetical protein